ncbi:MAG: hypothetical protein Q8873_06610 [Bacillota bacterium]|nr:hypothetical protein [Bacillota bacterium]
MPSLEKTFGLKRQGTLIFKNSAPLLSKRGNTTEAWNRCDAICGTAIFCRLQFHSCNGFEAIVKN